jgi:hypothetical protein
MSDNEDKAEIQAENELGDQIRDLITPIGGGVPAARATVAMAQAFAFLVLTTENPHLRCVFNELVDGILDDFGSGHTRQ